MPMIAGVDVPSQNTKDSVSVTERDAITALVAKAVGAPVRHVHGEATFIKKAAQRKRYYGCHRVEILGSVPRELDIFVKTLVRTPDRADRVEHFLSSRNHPEFRVPFYYGKAQTDVGLIGIWELVHGEHLVSNAFRNASDAQCRSVVLAVGGINALTPEATERLPDLPVGVKDIAPFAEAVIAALEEMAPSYEIVPYMREAAELLPSLEQPALDRLANMPGNVFSHQDIGLSNILFDPDGGKPIVIDWESAYMGLPGASLRRFSRMPEASQQDMVDLYVEFMASKGFNYRNSDILFTMRAMEIIYSLGWSSRRYKEKPEQTYPALRWALRHSSRYLI